MKRKFLATPLAAVAIACTVLLGGCGGPTIEEQIRADITEAFDSISPTDEELISGIEAGAGDSFDLLGIDVEDFAEKYFEGFEYSIGDIEVDEKAGTATADVTVKMRSLTDAMEDFTEDYEAWISTIDPTAIPTEEEIYAKGGELLMAAVSDCKPEESDLTFTYSKDDEGNWNADEGTESALLGAML